MLFLCPKDGEKLAKEIGQLNVKIGLDSTGFQNGISSLNREMKKVQSEFKLASAEMGKHGKELDSLKLKSDSLTKQTELQRQKVKALEEAHQKSVETKGADAKATQDLDNLLNTKGLYRFNPRYLPRVHFSIRRTGMWDIVTVQNKDWNITMDTRITEVEEIYEAGGFKLNVTFGKNTPTLTQKLKSTLREMKIESTR